MQSIHFYFFPFQRLAGATLLVFANKQDLPGALSKEAIREVRFIPTADTMTRDWFDSCNKNLKWFLPVLQALGLDEIKTHHWCIISCSAITGENLLAGVDWLLNDIVSRIFTSDWDTGLFLFKNDTFLEHNWWNNASNRFLEVEVIHYCFWLALTWINRYLTVLLGCPLLSIKLPLDELQRQGAGYCLQFEK